MQLMGIGFAGSCWQFKMGEVIQTGLVRGGIQLGTIQSGGVHSRYLEVQIVQLGHADGQRFPQNDMAWPTKNKQHGEWIFEQNLEADLTNTLIQT